MKLKTNFRFLGTSLLALTLLAGVTTPVQAGPVQIKVEAKAETAAIKGDADDPAIWVHPSDPAKSLVVGTDKKAGLNLYRMDGSLVTHLPDGELNNVDLRDFKLAGKAISLVGSSRRDDDTIAFHLIDANGNISRATPFTFPAAPADMRGEVKGRCCIIEYSCK